MKRLFTVNGEHFESKVLAKQARGPKNDAGNYTHPVRKGPDHDGNHGHKVPATRHRAPQGYNEPKAKTELAA
jgi:hypothetical protein